MKIFQIWKRISEYVVLQCPYKNCNHIFKRDTSNFNVFGNKVKNAKCQRCEKNFPIEGNTLDNDPLHLNIEGYSLRKEIVEGKEVKEENPLTNKNIPEPDFLSASEIK